MRILALNKIYFTILTLTILTFKTQAQEQNISVVEDPKFEQLLNEKRKINTSLTVNDSYKIQIFSGGSEIAKKTLSEFKQEFKDIDATIVFNTPNYKVWVGNFKTRIEAERNLANIKNRYKNVLLIKPNKQNLVLKSSKKVTLNRVAFFVYDIFHLNQFANNRM